MARVDDIVAAIQGAGDYDQADVLRRVNQAHDKALTGSKWARATLDMGPTVPGTAFYALPARIIEPLFFSLNGVPTGKGAHADVYGYSAGVLSWSTTGSLLVSDADASGVAGVTVIPEPTAALELLVYGSVLGAAPLAVGGTPLTPSDFDEQLENYALALCRERDDDRQDSASGFRSLFEAEVEMLRRRAKRRDRGAGPAQIRVVGVNA